MCQVADFQPLLRSLNAKIIILHRDPRAIFNSRLKIMPQKNKVQMMERAIAKHCHIMLNNYKITHENHRHDQECLKSKVLNVKFEDITVDPMRYASELYNFADLETPSFLENWAKINSFIDKNHVNQKFKVELHAEQIKRVEFLCAEYMDYLGYRRV